MKDIRRAYRSLRWQQLLLWWASVAVDHVCPAESEEAPDPVKSHVNYTMTRGAGSPE